MNPVEATCPSNDCQNTCPVGEVLCPECADRLWQELHWLADLYDHLLEALTRRLNVEKAEQVKVRGGKDPMVRGLDLYEDAVSLRQYTRQTARVGTAWLAERGLAAGEAVGADPARALRFTARNLHWLLTDQDPDRVRYFGARVVWARTQAEALVTPSVSYQKIPVQDLYCVHTEAHPDGVRVCAGALYFWSGDTTEAVCATNPAHTVSRETLVLLRTKLQRGKGARLAKVVRRVLGEEV